MFDSNILNRLLMDELSATASYADTLDEIDEDADTANALLAIHDDHQQAISLLQAGIRDLGGTPAENQDKWGKLAEVMQEGANLLGKKAGLMVLHLGERNGAADYQQVLACAELPAELRKLIETRLLPARLAHIQILEGLLEMAMAGKG